MNDSPGSVPRRLFLAAAPVTALGVSAGGASAGPVETYVAEPPLGPIPTAAAFPGIASARRDGVVHRSVSWLDCQSTNPAVPLRFAGYGRATVDGTTMMVAPVEVPEGAQLREIELYAFNITGPQKVDVFLWVTSTGYLTEQLGQITVPTQSAVAQAVRIDIDAARRGPYPSGAKVVLQWSQTSTGWFQVNGARLGFTGAGARLGMLAAPRRIHDSATSGGKLSTTQSRLITAPASLIPTGCVGLHVNLVTHAADGTGFLKIWPANAAEPSASVLRFRAGQEEANALPVLTTAQGAFRVRPSAPVHLYADVVGIYT